MLLFYGAISGYWSSRAFVNSMALENQLEQLAGSRIPAATKPTLTADASGSTDGSSNDEVRPTAPCMAEVGQERPPALPYQSP
jgi:hypothetical protein